MPIGNRNWKSAGALTALVLMLFTTVSVPEMTVNAGNSYAASGSAAATADERKNETSLTNELYARAAVLMDAENGRILFSKNGDEVLPMASTTKIMTCVLALETGNPEDVLPVSSYAARQPKVHMGVQKGEYYRMEDLLYGLMLESYNDAAVVIAEYYGSKAAGLSMDCSLHTEEESRKAVLTFAREMNEKAKEIGCENTFFITPNGLDAELETDGTQKQHSCTAADLAAIMRYCAFMSPQKETFLTITRTASRQFCSLKKAQDGTFETGTRTVSAANHNAFLQMMDGMLSGKTGFTGNAGYCYVCAVRQDEKFFIVALLGCGWPGNKNYKWSDAKKLLAYGRNNYRYVMLPDLPVLPDIPVSDAVPKNGELYSDAQITLKLHAAVSSKDLAKRYLLKKSESITWEADLPEKLEAPVKKNQKIGSLHAKLDGKEIFCCLVTAEDKIGRITYKWYADKIFHDYFH